MKLEGIHHVSAVTGDAERNVDFYARLLGLRLVWQGANADDPTMRHIAYGDETGRGGSILTFFDIPGAARGRPGAGMVYRITWQVASHDALDFWAGRLADAQVPVTRGDGWVRFADPEGLELELVVYGDSTPLVAYAPDIPGEVALEGLHGVWAYTDTPGGSTALLRETLGFELPRSGDWLIQGEKRRGFYRYEIPPPGRGIPGAGTVHHVAFASRDEDHVAWHDRLVAAGAYPSPVLDRMFFRSIYFREPSGVLLEIATEGPGFVFEPPEHLGESLVLIGPLEHRRRELELRFPLLPNPRARANANDKVERSR